MLQRSFTSGIAAAFAAVVAVITVHGAPIPRAVAIAAATMVDGLPSCSKPIMNDMILRAPSFGCENANGTPEVACLCRNKPFKKLAKEGVRAGCSDDADIGSTKRWAIDRCTAALTAARFTQAVPRATEGEQLAADASATPSTGAAVRVPASVPTEVKNTTMAWPVAIFDLDDDEDQTAAAGILRPAARTRMLLAIIVSSAAVWL